MSAQLPAAVKPDKTDVAVDPQRRMTEKWYRWIVFADASIRRFAKSVISFLDLSDTPSTYSGQGGNVVAVKGSEDGLEFITAATGTVTSVALTAPSEFNVAGSPITTSGTLALTWATEAANKIFAGPTSGSAATPAFRTLVAADIPALSYAPQTSGSSILYGNGSGGFSNVTIGSGLSFVAGTLAATDSGTVSSVGLSLPAIFSVSGSPVTGSGTLTGTLANQSANLVWAGPASGSAAAPTFRALVAADVPSGVGGGLPLVTGDTGGSPVAIADPVGQFIACGATTAGRSITNYLGAGPIASRPATPDIGSGTISIWYATDTVALSIYTGSSWVTP